ncbi:MAG: hypothetical protein D4R64_13395 [Porphyromonadaceae bacterium]|nr:MAG: hypothetical protein D4R64_13395 [Porphyromonadaceae bacterium]
MKKIYPDQDIDKFLKQTFDGFQVTPPEKLWDNIELKLDDSKAKPSGKPKKSNKGWLTGGIILSMIGLLILIIHPDPKKTLPTYQPERTDMAIENPAEIKISPQPAASNLPEKSKIEKAQTKPTQDFVTPRDTAKLFATLTPSITYTRMPVLNDYPTITIAGLDKNIQPLRASGSGGTSVTPLKKPMDTPRIKIHNGLRLQLPKFAIPDLFPGNSFSDRLDFGLTMTPQYSSRILFYKSLQSQTSSDIADFNSSEDGAFSFCSGFFFSFNVNKSFDIVLGVNYSSFNQHLSIDSLRREAIGVNEYLVRSSPGNLRFTYSSTAPLTNEALLNTMLTFSSIDLPLSLKYRMFKNFYLNFGVLYSRLVNTNINIRATGFNGNFTTSAISGLRANNFGLLGGAGYSKNLTNRLRLDVGADCRLLLLPINTEATVKYLPVVFGLNISLSYKLSGSRNK